MPKMPALIPKERVRLLGSVGWGVQKTQHFAEHLKTIEILDGSYSIYKSISC